MDLPEPRTHTALLEPLELPPFRPARVTAPVRVLVRQIGTDPPEVDLVRYAVGGDEPDPAEGPDAAAESAHTMVDEETREPGRLRVADVVVRRAAADDPRLGPPAAWAAEALASHPYCGLVAYVDGPDRCVVRTRDGGPLRLTAAPDPDGRPDLCDPAAYACALHAWTASGRSPADAGPVLRVRTGTTVHRVTVEPLRAPLP
jgi:hypothetical protein